MQRLDSLWRTIDRQEFGEQINIKHPAPPAGLARFPGARVLAVEQGADGGPPWEVELRRPNGTTVDVELDAGYRIVATDEDDGPDDADFDDP